MRIPAIWLTVVGLTCACNSNESPYVVASLPTAPSAPARLVVVPQGAASDPGNWSPWFWPGWQPGHGEALTPAARVSGTIVDELCISNLRTAWDQRASCRRFSVSVPSSGRLDAFLHWSATPAEPGTIVLVAPDGRFTSKDSVGTEAQIFALVQKGEYGVLVISHVQTSQIFQLRAEFSN